MAGFNDIRQEINDNIYENQDGDITGVVLNEVLNDMVDAMEDGNLLRAFKGWWPDLVTLKAAITAQPGDSAYVKDASPATTWSIYVYSASATSDNNWANSGSKADTSNVQTFASGEEVNEVHIIDDFHTGGNANVLSAEMGKLIKEEFSELTIDNDFILYRDQSAIDQNIVVGNPVTTEIVSSSYFKIIRYDVDRSNYYYGSGPAHSTYDRNVYYWADAEENLLKKETLQHSTSPWSNYLLVPPPGAKYLYVNEIRSSTYASQYQINVYVWKTIDQDKTHLCDPNAKDNALAVDVMPMKVKLEGVTASEVKATIGEQISGYINGNGAPAAVSSGSTTTYVVIALNNAKSVRLLGSTNASTGTNYTSYAFWNSATYVDSNTVVEAHNWDVREGSTNYAKEYKLIVPDGATHIAVSLSTNTNQPNFYCYLQNGKTVKDEINGLQQELFDSLYEKKPVVTIPVVNPDTESEFKSINNAVVGNQITNYYANSTTQKIWRYEIEEGHSYFLSGYWRISSSYTIASWTDINGIILKIEPLHGGDTVATALTLTDEEIIAPAGAKYLYILNRVVNYLTNPVLKDWQKKNFTPETPKKQVRILAIGNSYSQDALAYVPYILPNISDDIDLTVGILYKDGASLADHWSAWEGNTNAYTFWIYQNESGWASQSSKSIRYALDNYEWDIIVTHQKSSDSYYPDDAYEVNHQPYLNNLLNAIQNYVDYTVKYAWMLIQSRPGRGGTGTPNYTDAQILSDFNNIVANAQTVLDETLCEAVIPWGTAIQNARTISSICELGHYADQSAYSGNTSGKGYLTYDGVHLQEGLPCQIAAYSVILSILGLCGESYKSVIGETTIADAAWLQEKTIPGGNGVSVGATKENVMLGQKCAVMAFKKPYAVTDMNYIVNPV